MLAKKVLRNGIGLNSRIREQIVIYHDWKSMAMEIDMILFCDTGLEFPDMYTHIDKLEKYIGRPITRIRAEHSFELH